MKFTIVERKMKIDDDLRQYALRKVEKLDRYFHQDSDTTLTFSELRGKQDVYKRQRLLRSRWRARCISRCCSRCTR